MEFTIKEKKKVDIKYLQVSAGARYWEDSEVNGVEDTMGNLIPFRNGDYWEPLIEIETGKIIDWPKGTTANIHYKVCDDGTYRLQDGKKKTLLTKEYYVPDCMCPKEQGYGDYIIMDIDENGVIQDWRFNQKDLKVFQKDENEEE